MHKLVCGSRTRARHSARAYHAREDRTARARTPAMHAHARQWHEQRTTCALRLRGTRMTSSCMHMCDYDARMRTPAMHAHACQQHERRCQCDTQARARQRARHTHAHVVGATHMCTSGAHIYAHGTCSSSHKNVTTRALAQHELCKNVGVACARASTHAHVNSVSHTCTHAQARHTHARTHAHVSAARTVQARRRGMRSRAHQ